MNLESPFQLPALLALLPNINSISVLYSAQFIMPTVSFTTFASTSVFNITGGSATKTAAVTFFLNNSMKESNRDDIRLIFLALMNPNQVLLSIDFSQFPNSYLAALFCKLLFNYSITMRHITERTNIAIERAIAEDLMMQKAHVRLDPDINLLTLM